MNWSGRLSFVIASIGAVVGLGSLWFLPYQVYSSGGAVFFIFFSFFTLSIASFALYAEVLLGRTIQSSLWKGLPQLSPKTGKFWSLLFYLTLAMVISFYSVVSSQAFYCAFFQTLSLSSMVSSPLNEVSLIDPLQNSISQSMFFLSSLWALLYLVLRQPLAKGLEKASKILMGLLVLALIIMIIHSQKKGILWPAVTYLFAPNWENFTYDALLKSFTTALFGLAVGAGCMISYGSYLHQQQKRRHLLKDVYSISLSCLFISLLSCLSLFPYVFAAQVPFTSGPNLVFEVLPVVFKSFSSFGESLAALYLIALFTAGFTSCFSVVEPFILLLCEQYSLQRPWAAALTSFIGFIFSALIVLDEHLFNFDIMGIVITLVTEYFLPFGVLGVFYLVFCQAQMNKKVS